MPGQHLAGLNPPQQEAVETLSGPLLVLAGAGTGKTRVVTCRMAEIVSRGVSPSAICAVTFTNKAAKEMKERVRKTVRLGKKKLQTMVVSTFHSLGLRILRDHGHHLGLRKGANIADESDQLSIMTDVMRESGLARTVIRPNDARWKVSLWKNQGLRPDDALESAELGVESTLAVAYGRYEAELRRQGLLDFDDLILRPLDLFKEAPQVLRGLQDQWHYLLVDEYQDTNGCQYELIKAIGGARRNICCVGDDDQSIYAWRGADPERVLRFTRDFPGAVVVTLEQNYRSTGLILEGANRLITTNTQRREKKLWSALGRGEPIELYIAEDEKDEVDFVTTRAMLLGQKEAMCWEDCAILFRANSQCRPLEQALRARQIPYKVVGTRSFFDRREVRDLLSFVRLAKNPADDAALLRIVNVPPRGIGKSSIDKVLGWAAEDRASAWSTMKRRADDLPARARDGVRSLEEIVTTIEELARVEGVTPAISWLTEATQYRDHLRQTVDDALELQTRLTIVDELEDTARTLEATSGKASLESFLDTLALREQDFGDKEDQSDGITLLTMHAAKGLEFPYVFIVGMEEGILPHRNSIGSEEDDAPDDRAIEEERRLAYVGVTRARQRLFLSYARERTRFGRTVKRTMSRFLEELGLDTLHVTDSTDDTPADPEVGREMLRKIRSRFSGGGPSNVDSETVTDTKGAPDSGAAAPTKKAAWWESMDD